METTPRQETREGVVPPAMHIDEVRIERNSFGEFVCVHYMGTDGYTYRVGRPVQPRGEDEYPVLEVATADDEFLGTTLVADLDFRTDVLRLLVDGAGPVTYTVVDTDDHYDAFAV